MSRDWHPWMLIPTVALVAPAWGADYLSAADAQKVLFPQADRFTEHFIALDDDQRDAIRKLSGVRQRWDEQKVWRAEKDGQLLGWFIVDDVVGKHEFITYATAIDAHGGVIGIEIMSYRETHGDEVRRAEWRAQFAGKTLDDPFKLNKDIPNISGATLSCRNVTDGVKRLLALYQLELAHG